jgi:hypothetical protein
MSLFSFARRDTSEWPQNASKVEVESAEIRNSESEQAWVSGVIFPTPLQIIQGEFDETL